MIKKNDPDIICVQETWSKININIPCYTNFAKPREHKKGGGLCIYVRKNIQSEQVQLSFLDVNMSKKYEIQGINIKAKKTEYKIYNIYVFPKSNLDFDYLFNMLNFDGNAIIMGDFNSKSLKWNKTGSNKTGENLSKTILKQNLVIHNKFKETLTNNFDVMSTVDLIITKKHTSINIKELKVGKHIGSDHLPVMFKCVFKDTPQIINKKMFIYKRLNCQKYKNFLCKKFPYFYLHSLMCNDINDLYKMFVSIFLYSTKKFCPVKTITYKNKKNGTVWWNDEIKNAIKLRNKYRKKLNKNKCTLNVENLKNQQKK